MQDEPDEHYQPWLRDSGGKATPTQGSSAQPAAPPAAPPRRDARALSADELLARPAPLPTDMPDGPDLGDRVRDGLSRAATRTADGLRAANARIEPGRRAREAGQSAASAGRAALRGGRKAAGIVAAATVDAANKLRAAAGPKVRQASDAARAGLTKGADSARHSIGKGADAARTRIGQGTQSAKATLRAVIPERPVPVDPPSELGRLIEREDAPAIGATPPPTPAGRSANGLPLFADGGQSPAPMTATPQPVAPPAASATIAPPAPPAPPAQPMQAVDAGGARAAPSVGSRPSLANWARHPATWGLAALILILGGFGLGRWSAGGMSRADIGSAVEEHILANPQIIPQAMERLQANRASEAIGRVSARLTTPFSGAWAGNAGGDVTMVVFTDYACTFCRASMADMDRLLRTDPNLKIVFRELPILSQESEAAARLALFAARRGQYMPMHRALFRSQLPDGPARTAAAASLNLEVAPADLADAAINRELESNVELARALGIDGTPSWIIGDRLLTGAVGYDTLRGAIAAARE